MIAFWDLVCCGIVVYVVVQTVRFIFADADLQLLTKAKFGLSAKTLSGKTVWITGASGGIGEYLAYDLSKAGCKLILSARRIDELERVKNQCLVYSKVREEDILIQELDLLQVHKHKQIVNQILTTVKKVDILVNNAGRSQRSLIKDTDLDVDKQILELNVIGTISVTKALLPHFIQNKCGHIVITSSIAGKIGAPISAAYSASKHALQGWYETLRTEFLDDNIDVTLVCPGPVYSNITKEAFTGQVGKTHGVPMQSGENRMKTERCSELIVAAIANKLGEVWISNQPILFFTYVFQYMPDIGRWLARKVGSKQVEKLRKA